MRRYSFQPIHAVYRNHHLKPHAGRRRVLLVSDDLEVNSHFTHRLDRSGYDVVQCRRQIDFWVLLNSYDPGALLQNFCAVICCEAMISRSMIPLWEGIEAPPLLVVDRPTRFFEGGPLPRGALWFAAPASLDDVVHEVKRVAPIHRPSAVPTPACFGVEQPQCGAGFTPEY